MLTMVDIYVLRRGEHVEDNIRGFMTLFPSDFLKIYGHRSCLDVLIMCI